MPLYEYLCRTCGKNFEIQHKMAEPTPSAGPGCPRGECSLDRQISRVAGVVKSPNPFAKAAAMTADMKPTETKSEQKSHQCGSGCALHSH